MICAAWRKRLLALDLAEIELGGGVVQVDLDDAVSELAAG